MKLEHELPNSNEIINMVACPKCDAAIGEPCDNERMVQHGNAGRRQSNHMERIRAARAIMREKRNAIHRH